VLMLIFKEATPFISMDGISIKLCSPLAIAIIENQLETAHLLIKRGANISETETNLQLQCIADDYFLYPEVPLERLENLLSDSSVK
jgi:hypothetical protein